MTWAADNGIVNGTSTSTFSPNANVTREQMAAILYRYAQYKKYNTAASSSLNSFSDHTSVSGYAVASLQWSVAEKLVNGSAGKAHADWQRDPRTGSGDSPSIRRKTSQEK